MLNVEWYSHYDAYSETVEEKQENSDALTSLSDQIMRLTVEVQELKKRDTQSFGST